MEKVWTYLMMITGILLLFYFTGLSSGAGTLLSMLLDPENIYTSEWWISVSVLGGGIISGVVIGIVTRNAELAIMSPITAYLLVAAIDIMMIFNYLASLNWVLAVLFMSPFIYLIPVTFIEYWRGRDT